MATFDDFDGVFFTIQALRLAHREVLDELELLVLDNNPGSADGQAVKAFAAGVPNVRYVPFTGYHSTAARDLLFRETEAEIVLCIDAHVLIQPGGLRALLRHFDANPGSRDIIQGPLLNDDLENGHGTHFDPVWGGGMYGQWAIDDRWNGPDSEPFEIPMQGLGLFACRREAWPGINPRFRGFGGEEGYLHEKFRRQGGRALCLPALGWNHRFARPAGAPYPNSWQDRLRNYHVGWSEVGWDPAEVDEYFRELLAPAEFAAALALTRRQLASPLIGLDGILCISSDSGEGHFRTVTERLAALDSGWRLERFPSEPGADAIRSAILSFRAAIAAARRREYASVLVIPREEDPDYAGARLDGIAAAVAQIGAEPWELIWPAGGEGPRPLAVNASTFDHLLEELPPDDGEPLEAFVAAHETLEGYLEGALAAGRLRGAVASVTPPVASPSRGAAPAASEPEAAALSAQGALPSVVLSLSGFGVSMSVIDTSGMGIADQLAAVVASELISAPVREVDLAYRVRVVGSGRLSATIDGQLMYEAGGGRDMVRWLRASIDAELAFRAKDVMILHAGVVGWRGHAIVLPGRSGVGKSTLVAALVRDGATYYSDDYAPIDPEGLVHAYARPLQIGLGESDPGPVRHIEPNLVSDRQPRPPLPVGMVVLSTFRAGARWRPQPLAGARGALAVLDHVIMTRHQPRQAMALAHLIASDSLVLSGARPDARRVAADLIGRLDELLDAGGRGVSEDRLAQRRPQRSRPVVAHVGHHQ